MTNTTLTVGALGGDVIRLHTFLQAQGLQPSEQEVKQGSFGPDTRRVVAQFQQQNGLQPTGVVDPQTAAAIGLAIAAGPVQSARTDSISITGAVDGATMAAINAAISSGRIVDPVPLILTETPPADQTPALSLSSTVKKSLKMVIPPLRRNDQGAGVVNLQDALLLLFERGGQSFKKKKLGSGRKKEGSTPFGKNARKQSMANQRQL